MQIRLVLSQLTSPRNPPSLKRAVKIKVKEAEAFAVHAELKGQEMSEEAGTVGEFAHI